MAVNPNEEVKMTHSALLAKGGKKYVSVRFERGNDVAEGSLPEGKITKNSGFTKEEIAHLESYMDAQSHAILTKARELSNIRNLL
ncbi:MAG: hypothetical protein ACI4AD_07095 [Roseburia sp.]